MLVYFYPLFSVCLWALTFVVIRILKMDVVFLATSRLTISALAFFLFLSVGKQLFLPDRKRDKMIGLLILSAFTGFVFYNLLINFSLQYLPAGILAALINTLPLISLFFGYLFFKSGSSPLRWWALG